MGAASQDVFVSGKGIQAHLDPTTNEYVESFRSGAKVEVEAVAFSTGGGATNAAVTFARQGLESSFIGRVGSDVAAEAVHNELDREFVDSSRVITDPQLGTQYSTILLAESGERTILVYRGAAQAHKAKEYENIDFSEFDWLYISSFGGAFEALDTVFARATAAGVKIAFNPGGSELSDPKKLRALLEDVEVLIMNKEEAAQVVEGTSGEELVQHALHYASVVIVSDGANGVYASDGKTSIRAGMYEDVPVIDRTGAGDAFGSGFLSQWAQGKSLKDAIIFASANSTSVVTRIGAKEGILQKGVKLHDMPLKEEKIG